MKRLRSLTMGRKRRMMMRRMRRTTTMNQMTMTLLTL